MKKYTVKTEMSRKKLFINENNLFATNINALVKKNGGKTAFAEAINVNYDTVRSWCLGEFLPGGAQLSLIRDKFVVSIDWLLAGTGPYVVPHVADDMPSYGKPEEHRCPFCGGMSEEMKDLCKRVKDIMESGHPFAVKALESNIDAFEDSVKQAKEIEELKETVRHHSKLLDPVRITGTGKAAGTGTKKKGI